MAEVMRRMKINELPSQAEEIDEAGLIVYTEDGSKVYCAKMTDFVAKVKELYSSGNLDINYNSEYLEEGAETEFFLIKKDDETGISSITDNMTPNGTYAGARNMGNGFKIPNSVEAAPAKTGSIWRQDIDHCPVDFPPDYKDFYDSASIRNDNTYMMLENVNHSSYFNKLYVKGLTINTSAKVEQINNIVSAYMHFLAFDGKILKLRDIFKNVPTTDPAGDLLIGFFGDYYLDGSWMTVSELTSGGPYEDLVQRYGNHRYFTLKVTDNDGPIPIDPQQPAWYRYHYKFTLVIPNIYYAFSDINISTYIPINIQHNYRTGSDPSFITELIENGMNSTVAECNELDHVVLLPDYDKYFPVFENSSGYEITGSYELADDLQYKMNNTLYFNSIASAGEYFQTGDDLPTSSPFHDGPRWAEEGPSKGPVPGNIRCSYIEDDAIIPQDMYIMPPSMIGYGGTLIYLERWNDYPDSNDVINVYKNGDTGGDAQYSGLSYVWSEGEGSASVGPLTKLTYGFDYFQNSLDIWYPHAHITNKEYALGTFNKDISEDPLRLSVMNLNHDYFYVNNKQRNIMTRDAYTSNCDSVYIRQDDGVINYGQYILNKIINNGMSADGRHYISSFKLNGLELSETMTTYQSGVFISILRANGLATFTDHGVYGFGLTQELYSQLQPALEFGDGIEYDEETGEVTAEGSCRDILVNGRTVVNPLDKIARINLANVNLIQECQIQPGTNYDGHTVVAREMVEEFDTDQIRHTYYSYTIGLSSDIIPSEQAYNPSQINIGPYEYGPYTVGSTQSLPSNESYVVIFDTVIVSPVDSVFCLFLKDNSHQSGYPFDPSNQYYDSDYVDFDIQSVKANVPTKFRIVKVVPATNASPVTFASYQASIMNTLPYSAWPLPSNIYAYGNTTVKKLINV